MEAAYQTGKRIVEMAHEDLCPSKIITKEALQNVIRVNTAIGGSTNAPIHFAAIARHAGVELTDVRGMARGRVRAAAACQHATRRPSTWARIISAPGQPLP